MSEYSFEEFSLHLKGHERKEALEWDRTRHVMFAIVKANGNKKIRSPKDLLELPILDGTRDNPGVRESLLKRLAEYKKRHEPT